MANKQHASSFSLALVAMAMAVILLAGEAMATRPLPQQSHVQVEARVEANVNANNNIKKGVAVGVEAKVKVEAEIKDKEILRSDLTRAAALVKELIVVAKIAKVTNSKHSEMVAACDAVIPAMEEGMKHLNDALNPSYFNNKSSSEVRSDAAPTFQALAKTQRLILTCAGAGLLPSLNKANKST